MGHAVSVAMNLKITNAEIAGLHSGVMIQSESSSAKSVNQSSFSSSMGICLTNWLTKNTQSLESKGIANCHSGSASLTKNRYRGTR